MSADLTINLSKHFGSVTAENYSTRLIANGCSGYGDFWCGGARWLLHASAAHYLDEVDPKEELYCKIEDNEQDDCGDTQAAAAPSHWKIDAAATPTAWEPKSSGRATRPTKSTLPAPVLDIGTGSLIIEAHRFSPSFNH